MANNYNRRLIHPQSIVRWSGGGHIYRYDTIPMHFCSPLITDGLHSQVSWVELSWVESSPRYFCVATKSSQVTWIVRTNEYKRYTKWIYNFRSDCNCHDLGHTMHKFMPKTHARPRISNVLWFNLRHLFYCGCHFFVYGRVVGDLRQRWTLADELIVQFMLSDVGNYYQFFEKSAHLFSIKQKATLICRHDNT